MFDLANAAAGASLSARDSGSAGAPPSGPYKRNGYHGGSNGPAAKRRRSPDLYADEDDEEDEEDAYGAAAAHGGGYDEPASSGSGDELAGPHHNSTSQLAPRRGGRGGMTSINGRVIYGRGGRSGRGGGLVQELPPIKAPAGPLPVGGAHRPDGPNGTTTAYANVTLATARAAALRMGLIPGPVGERAGALDGAAAGSSPRGRRDAPQRDADQDMEAAEEAQAQVKPEPEQGREARETAAAAAAGEHRVGSGTCLALPCILQLRA